MNSYSKTKYSEKEIIRGIVEENNEVMQFIYQNSYRPVRHLVMVNSGNEEDARDIGFDEGPKPPDWVQLLSTKGITVFQDVCRDEAVAVLRHYLESGGIIYNGRQALR